MAKRPFLCRIGFHKWSEPRGALLNPTNYYACLKCPCTAVERPWSAYGNRWEVSDPEATQPERDGRGNG